MVNKIVKWSCLPLSYILGMASMAVYNGITSEKIRPTAGTNYAEIETREVNARKRIEELLGENKGLAVQTEKLEEEKRGFIGQVNSLAEKSRKLEKENQGYTELKTKLAESQAEEGKVIHQLVSSPYFNFLTFPMARAEVNTDKNCLEKVVIVEYNRQGEWDLIDRKEELCTLAGKVSGLYKSDGDKKGAFGKLGELCGLSKEDIAGIYGEDARIQNYLDGFADLGFRSCGQKVVSYIEQYLDEKGNEQSKIVVIGPLDYIKKLVGEE